VTRLWGKQTTEELRKCPAGRIGEVKLQLTPWPAPMLLCARGLQCENAVRLHRVIATASMSLLRGYWGFAGLILSSPV
jgi:hypothetical protein